tara:strand:- start:188 stop:514 length:327 start_codon:yes stop_codon:yes gene_type:complete
MANEYKILKQHAGGTSATTYTVPASTSAIVSSIVVANRASSAKTFRISVYPSGGSGTADASYLAYDTAIAANDVVTMTLGITLATGEALQLYGSDTNVSINAFGTQIT